MKVEQGYKIGQNKDIDPSLNVVQQQSWEDFDSRGRKEPIL